MVIYDDEILNEIENYSYNLMSWTDIAYLLDIPIDKFSADFHNKHSRAHVAYQKGRVRRKFELRQPILDMAVAGSPQAELLSIKFLEEQLLDETTD